MPTLHFYKDERSEDEVIQNKTAEISAVLLFIFVVFYNTTYKLNSLSYLEIPLRSNKPLIKLSFCIRYCFRLPDFVRPEFRSLRNFTLSKGERTQ